MLEKMPISYLMLLIIIIVVGVWIGCGEPEFVPNIREIASSSLVYLTIKCPEDNIVHSIVNSSGGVIGDRLVITYNACADDGVWGVVRTIEGVEYEIEAAVDSEHGVTVLKVRGLEAPALTVASSNSKVPDTMFIAANPYDKGMAYTIGEHTRKSVLGLGITLDYGWIRADTSRNMGLWKGGIVLNYEGELIGIVRNYVANRPRRAFIVSMGMAERLSY